MNNRNYALGLGAMLLLAGCASERVVLLPSADGYRSAVVVRDATGELLLDKPYAAASRRVGSNSAYQATPEEVQQRFGAALAAQPMRPNSYILYFEPGGNVLTPESQAVLARMQQEIVERAAAEVMVIGHTDRVGSEQGNDALSKKRAEAVRNLLIDAGVAAEKLEAVGRGERDPLVATEDEVDEPKNRRVEINLR
ncbi:MAG: OmpA family protein [Azonexus sp.]|nr:OmpA family protein [Azonexus sp.]